MATWYAPGILASIRSHTMECAELLNRAENGVLRLEKDGVMYRLSRDESEQEPEYNPTVLRDTVRVLAGSLCEAEAILLRNTYTGHGRAEAAQQTGREVSCRY